jgi:hypothetical protein
MPYLQIHNHAALLQNKVPQPNASPSFSWSSITLRNSEASSQSATDSSVPTKNICPGKALGVERASVKSDKFVGLYC